MTGEADTRGSAATHHLPGARATADEVLEGARLLQDAPAVGQLLESVPGPAVVLNRFRQILAANRRLLDDLGLTSVEDVLGRRPGEAVDCVGVAEAPAGCGTGHRCAFCGCANTVAQCLRDEQPAAGECRIRREDGLALDIEITAAPAVVDDLPVVFVGMRDVSAERRREVFERAFFHDVLNTAGGIQGLLDLATRSADPRLHEEVRRSLVVLAEDLVSEIQSHRQLCDAEAGQLDLRLRTVSLPRVLDSVRDAYAHHRVADGRRLRVDASSDVSLHTDPALLRRVLGNMVKNALEATPQEGEVRLWAEAEGGEVRFHVRNPGVVPEEVAYQIFQRSFSTKGPGRGVGTYSMKLLGERLLGGHVTFVSEEESGTTFTFRLAAVCDAEGAEDQDFDAAGARVLIADDFRMNRLILRRLLESRGCVVVEAADGDEAIRVAAAGGVDLVLTDLVMPRCDGKDVARAIRRSESPSARPPVVVLTGSADAPERDACLEAGADEVVEKPVRPEVLTEILTRHLPRR